jgi:hypothetical protein
MAKKGCGPLGCRNKLMYLKAIDDQNTPTGPPTITVSTNAIPFGYGKTFNPNLILPFTVQGSGLTGSITATIILDATNRFKINSVGDDSEGDPVVLNPAGSSVPLTNLYAVFDLQDLVPASYTATIELSSPGAVTKTIALSGRIVDQVVIGGEDFDAAGVSGLGAPYYKFPVGWILPGAPYEPLPNIFVYDDGGVVYPYSPISGLRSLAFANGLAVAEFTTAKPFSTINRVEPTIDIWQYRNAGSPGLVLEWSDDNATWNNAGLVNVADDDIWHRATIFLPVGAENKANIYLRFTMPGDASGLITAVDDLFYSAYE